MIGFGSRPFRDRADAARQLAVLLKGRAFRDPLVLAVPRGGVVTGVVLARELVAELDVVLSRKLRAPYQPEYALGAVSEDGHVILDPMATTIPGVTPEYLTAERQHQLAEIEQRKGLFRAVRPPAPIAGRTVIVTDDGIATGATLIAALQTVRTQHPAQLIAAVPVAAPDRLDAVRQFCDEAICLRTPADFRAVGQFYEWFEPIEDEEVVRLLREATPGG